MFHMVHLWGYDLAYWSTSVCQSLCMHSCACFVSVLHRNVCVRNRCTRVLTHVYAWMRWVSIRPWMRVFEVYVWPSVIDYRQAVIGIITLLSGGLSQRHSASHLNTAQTASEVFDVLTCALNSSEIWMTYQKYPWTLFLKLHWTSFFCSFCKNAPVSLPTEIGGVYSHIICLLCMVSGRTWEV